MSRFGRDYLKTGELIEMVFPDYDVRYIAVNDNVDTAKSENELLAFKNILMTGTPVIAVKEDSVRVQGKGTVGQAPVSARVRLQEVGYGQKPVGN